MALAATNSWMAGSPVGAGSGSVEAAVSVLALDRGAVPPTRNYETPDPDCPVCVVSGRPLSGAKPVAMVLNHDTTGQAVAVALGGK